MPTPVLRWSGSGPTVRRRMDDLRRFGVADTARCAAAVHALGMAARSLEGFGQAVVRHLYDTLGDGQGGRGLALARFFKTLPVARMDPELAGLVSEQLELPPEPRLRGLVLLGSAGERPEWNDRKLSSAHRVIALPSAQAVQRSPMLSQLVRQLGLDVAEVVQPDDEIVALEGRTYNVFFVPRALGSAHIPDQAFVEQAGVRSVVGFGGVLPTGDLFALILFAKVELEPHVAELFRVLAVSVKAAALRFDRGPTLEATALAATP